MAKKPRNRAADFATYLVVRVIVAALQMMSPRFAYAVADFLAWLVYKLVKSRRRVALENVCAAFPECAADPVAAAHQGLALVQPDMLVGREDGRPAARETQLEQSASGPREDRERPGGQLGPEGTLVAVRHLVERLAPFRHQPREDVDAPATTR